MTRHLLAATALAALILPGCVVYDHRADVTLQWEVGPRQDCLPGDVVIVDLTEFGSSATDTVSSPCDAHEVTISNLDPDTYAVNLTLQDVTGAPLVLLQDTIDVHSGSNVFTTYSFYPN